MRIHLVYFYKYYHNHDFIYPTVFLNEKKIDFDINHVYVKKKKCSTDGKESHNNY